MPRPPGSHDPYKWTLDLPPGSLCSIGWSKNENVDEEGKSTSGRPNEDRYYTCTYQDKIQLYMVLDGHDGTRACDFVQKHLPYSVLRSDLERDDIVKALTMAFRSTEREFFIGIDPHITRRLTLVIEIQQKAENSHEAGMRCPQQVDEIHHLDNQIKGGTTVVVALIYNDQLFVANVGDSRALLCSVAYDHHGGSRLVVEQLSKDHNTLNDEELRRLVECGLDATELRRTRRLGPQQNTRSIGDYSIKGGYTDVDTISKARREPGSAEPHVSRPINLREFRGFLVLMSDGLYEAYEAYTKSPLMVNDHIAQLVADEMKKTSDLSVVAQNVVEKVKNLFRSTCKDGKRSGRLDDITLIVRNFGHPMALPHTQSYPSDMSGSTHPSMLPHHSQMPESLRLQSSISYPSHMHGQPGAPVGGLPTSYGSPYFQGTGPAGGYSSMTVPRMTTSSQYQNNYSGLYTEAQSLRSHVSYAHPPPGHGYDQGYYGGASVGGYPSNYPQYPPPPHNMMGSSGAEGGAGGQGLQQQPPPHHQQSYHQPVGYKASDPGPQIPRHPAYTQRSGSQGTVQTISSPEHNRQHIVGRREYENIPNPALNTITEATDSHLSSSPSQPSGGVAPGATYQNVTLRSQTNLQPGDSQGLHPNRYSDSCLVEKVSNVSLNESPAKLSTNDKPPEIPARPHSAEPSRPANDSYISALPSLQTTECDQEDENFLLYGWKQPPEDTNASLSTLKSQPGTLSSSELPSLSEGGVVSHPTSMTAPTSDTEAKTPVPLNGEVRQLGSSVQHDQTTDEQRKEKEEDEVKSDDDDEGLFTADMSDFSEASEAEGEGDEIDAVSGEIRSYIKHWGDFPVGLSWEEV